MIWFLLALATLNIIQAAHIHATELRVTRLVKGNKHLVKRNIDLHKTMRTMTQTRPREFTNVRSLEDYRRKKE